MEPGDTDTKAPPFLGRADSKTLMDIIDDDEGGGTKDSRKKWRHFKEKLKRNNSGGRGSAWTSSVPVPTSDIPINGLRSASRHPSSSRVSPIHDHTDPPDISAVSEARPPFLARNPSRAMESGRFDNSSMRRLQREEEEEEEEEEGGGEEEEEEERQPVRMSLMALLGGDDEDEDYMMDDDDDDEDEEEDGGGEFISCCVCMVRHKGTAFVPCGHSFCRLCSREMWVEDRGNNCPLCNNYILEILDIF